MKVVDPVQVLRTFVAKYPSQRAAAAALQVSQAYLSDLLNGRRALSANILSQLGLKQIVVKG
jgi:antitoxin component HigA of HigAB toxin-antitoxin module